MSILSDLNPAQEAVVRAVEGPVLVVAGAGSGKTTVLVRRVAWMIHQGITPSSILLLTFTRAAAASMLARARALTPAAREVTGGTFHSVGALVLRELHAVFGLPEALTVLDPEDVQEALATCAAAEPFPARGRAPKAATVAGVLSRVANTRVSVVDALATRAPDWVGAEAWFEAVGRRYTEWKLDRGLLDYDDLLTWFAVALGHPEVGAHLRARWPYVLVDEHQDSNAVQLDIVYGLGGDRPNVMAVGDPAQAIYAFRGSAPATLFHFRERWPNTRVLALETNYRSTQPILDLVNAIDRAMVPRFPRELRAANGESAERPVLVRVAGERAQAEELCSRVLAAREAGVALADQAVLVRSMWAARRVEAELLAQRIPYRVVGGLRIDEAAHVKDLLALARVAENPRNEPAWARVIGRLPGVGPATVKTALPTILAGDGPAVERLANVHWPRKAEPAPLLEALRALATPGEPAGRLRAAVVAFEPVFRVVYEGEWLDRRRDLETVVALAEEHAELGAFLAAITLDYSLDRREAVPEPRAEEAPLTLSTVHSAKGLEWHTVHIPNFVAGHIPSGYAASEEERAEELRVFYVAASRARRTLLLYRPLLNDEGWRPSESPYERIVEAFLEVEDPGKRPPPKAPSLQGVKLDMRAALLGRKT